MAPYGFQVLFAFGKTDARHTHTLQLEVAKRLWEHYGADHIVSPPA